MSLLAINRLSIMFNDDFGIAHRDYLAQKRAKLLRFVTTSRAGEFSQDCLGLQPFRSHGTKPAGGDCTSCPPPPPCLSRPASLAAAVGSPPPSPPPSSPPPPPLLPAHGLAAASAAYRTAAATTMVAAAVGRHARSGTVFTSQQPLTALTGADH